MVGSDLNAALQGDDRQRAVTRLSKLAALLFEAPIAHVTIIVGDRQYYHGVVGLPSEVVTPEGTSLEFGFCPTVVSTGEPMLHRDLADSPFRDNLAVTQHGARAYAGAPLRRPDGQVVGSLCVLDLRPRDWAPSSLELLTELAESVVTELELVSAQVQLREQADAARVLQHLSEGVLLLDVAGVVRIWNPAAERLTDVSSADAVGRSIGDVLAGWDHERDVNGVLSIAHPRGTRSLAIAGVTWPGGSAFAMRDITQEQRLTRMRDELVTTISHQMRTPLASILAAAVTLQRDDIVLDDAAEVHMLTMIEQQAMQLTDLSDDVLLASRLGARAQPVELQSIPLDELAAGVAEAFAMRPETAGRITVDVASGTHVLADPAALRQAMGNLLDNWLAYTPASSSMRVRGGPVTGDGADGVVELVLEDDGPGIPPDERASVFEKFYRLDPNMRTAAAGSGLGLYVCRELVEQMGGSIELGSGADGRGTRFTIRLAASAGAGALTRSA